MNARVFALSALLVALMPAQAAVSVSNLTNSTYTQTFDTLASSGSTGTALPAGWELYRVVGSSAPVAVSSYSVGTGSGTTGAIYSYGAAGSSDRALGALASNSFGGGVMALSLLNDTGHALAGLSLSYDGEQWRSASGAGVQSLVLEYGFGDTYGAVSSWSSLGADFASPVTLGTSSLYGSGNTTGLVSGITGGATLSWANGQTLWLRWVDANDSGSDHGLAIDNLSVSITSAVPEPSSYAMLLAGLGTVGFVARRRRK